MFLFESIVSVASPNKPLDGSLVNELRDNRYLNAKAGITSLSSRTEGSLGSVKYTTIEFTVFNKIDLISLCNFKYFYVHAHFTYVFVNIF